MKKLSFMALPIAAALSAFSMTANAEVDVTIDTLEGTTNGAVISAGFLSGGIDADLEVSIGSIAEATGTGTTVVANSVTGQVGSLGFLGLQADVINAVFASGGGDVCAKTMVGSIGNRTCIDDE